jgi:hypothetical protein
VAHPLAQVEAGVAVLVAATQVGGVDGLGDVEA